MTDRSDQLTLASLADGEIAGLIGAIPGLAASWAGLIGADIERLRAGQVPAPAALRMTLTRQNDQLMAALARTGLENILNILDSAECGEDADEGPIEFAAAAGRQFGPKWARVFLSAVAAGNDPLAREVASRLAELQAVAAENGQNSSADSSDGGDAEMSHHSLAAASAGPSSAGADTASLLALLTRTKELQDDRIGLVSLLRAAIADIESGKPPGNVGRRLDDWSVSVAEHLANAAGIVDAPNLDDLARDFRNWSIKPTKTIRSCATHCAGCSCFRDRDSMS